MVSGFHGARGVKVSTGEIGCAVHAMRAPVKRLVNLTLVK